LGGCTLGVKAEKKIGAISGRHVLAAMSNPKEYCVGWKLLEREAALG
jgi:hypothetical protein